MLENLSVIRKFKKLMIELKTRLKNSGKLGDNLKDHFEFL